MVGIGFAWGCTPHCGDSHAAGAQLVACFQHGSVSGRGHEPAIRIAALLCAEQNANSFSMSFPGSLASRTEQPVCSSHPVNAAQVSDLTGSFRLYRKECAAQLMPQCTSKVGAPLAILTPQTVKPAYLTQIGWCCGTDLCLLPVIGAATMGVAIAAGECCACRAMPSRWRS